MMCVVALAEDVVSDGPTPVCEEVPGCGCCEHLCALSVERKDLYAAYSTWVKELLFVLDGSCEFVVGVLGESKCVGDSVMVLLGLRDFHLNLRLEICASNDKPLTEGSGEGG